LIVHLVLAVAAFVSTKSVCSHTNTGVHISVCSHGGDIYVCSHHTGIHGYTGGHISDCSYHTAIHTRTCQCLLTSLHIHKTLEHVSFCSHRQQNMRAQEACQVLNRTANTHKRAFYGLLKIQRHVHRRAYQCLCISQRYVHRRACPSLLAAHSDAYIHSRADR
jgi:hypothetical protein